MITRKIIKRPEYDMGGTVAGVGGLLGAIPTPFTQIAGAALGVVGGLIGGAQQKQEEALALRTQMQLKGRADGMNTFNPYQATFGKGGTVPGRPLYSSDPRYANPTSGVSNPNYTPLTQQEAGKYSEEDLVIQPSTSKRTVNRLDGIPTQYFLKNYAKENSMNIMNQTISPVPNGYTIEGSRYKYNDNDELVFDRKDKSSYFPEGIKYTGGGIVPGAMPNIEAEGGEVMQGPDGSMAELQGAQHEQGGIPLAVEGGSRIFSDTLKSSTGKTFAEEADAIRKQIARYEKMLG